MQYAIAPLKCEGNEVCATEFYRHALICVWIVRMRSRWWYALLQSMRAEPTYTKQDFLNNAYPTESYFYNILDAWDIQYPCLCSIKAWSSQWFKLYWRVIGKVGMTGVKAMASIGNSLHLSLKILLGTHVRCKYPKEGQQIPLHTSVRWWTAQELSSLATSHFTFLEYDESKVCEDFFRLGNTVLEYCNIIRKDSIK